jgi:hypothetical protein
MLPSRILNGYIVEAFLALEDFLSVFCRESYASHAVLASPNNLPHFTLYCLSLIGGTQASRTATRSRKNVPTAARRMQVDPCLPTLNFFPTADEIGAKQLVNNKTCSGKQVCNFPAVWQMQNQAAYNEQLKTSVSSGLLSVAFKQYGVEMPRLFFTPVSKFLNSGSDVTACAASINPAATRRRSLLEDSTKYYVSKAGLWSYSVSYDGAPAQAGLQIARQSGQLDPAMLAKDVSEFAGHGHRAAACCI